MITTKQIWSLINGTQEYKFVYIQNLCPESGPNFVHISILDKNYIPTIEHAPFSTDAVIKSIDQLIETHSSIDLSEEGYQYWLTEHRKGDAGYFRLPILECIM